MLLSLNDSSSISPSITVFRLKQVHSKRVVSVPSEYHESMEGDGLVTDSAKDILAVTVGDCLPIFLYSSRGFGIVHSGWQGTGIAASAVKRISELCGETPGNVDAVIGPGIGKCCYAVPEERCDLFDVSCIELRSSKYYLDLKRANARILSEMGVKSIRVVDVCTQCDLRLGSFRRQGRANYDRMVAAIGYF
jgi:hypothetical protein